MTHYSAGSPFPLYYGDENDSKVKTTYKSSYDNENIMKERILSPAAGVPYHRHEESPSFFAYPISKENIPPNVESG